MSLAALVLAGVGAGFLAGLFGIGGGAVLVPLLYLILDSRMEGEGLTVMAHATSLAVIVPTAASALVRYQASKLVPWRVVGLMGGAAAVGAALTTRVVPDLPESGLRAAFALFLTVVALRMLRPPSPPDPGLAEEPSSEEGGELLVPLAGGGAVGVVSAALGVGGGTLAIPLLLFGVGLDVRRVAAASMGIVACAAVAGTVGYMAADVTGLPAGTVGWIYLPAVLSLTPGAILGARWGATVNTRISQPRLRVLFALLLLAVAASIFTVLVRG